MRFRISNFPYSLPTNGSFQMRIPKSYHPYTFELFIVNYELSMLNVQWSMNNELLPVPDIQSVLLRCCYLSALQIINGFIIFPC